MSVVDSFESRDEASGHAITRFLNQYPNYGVTSIKCDPVNAVSKTLVEEQLLGFDHLIKVTLPIGPQQDTLINRLSDLMGMLGLEKNNLVGL